ncbi:MAG TPA: hypothetical protein VFE61_19245 [Candidatus Sulfotelmatobacter sp.]|nr:hypothetical protein [Candidatus Sulfotelmatobacter sp.]
MAAAPIVLSNHAAVQMTVVIKPLHSLTLSSASTDRLEACLDPRVISETLCPHVMDVFTRDCLHLLRRLFCV